MLQLTTDSRLGRELMSKLTTSEHSHSSMTQARASIDNLWSRIELALRDLLSDIAVQEQALNIDRLLAFQGSWLDKLAGKFMSILQRITRSGNTPSDVLSCIKFKWLEQSCAAFTRDLEKWFAIFDTACRLLARLVGNDDGTSSAKASDAQPDSRRDSLTAVQHLRTLVFPSASTQHLTAPAFIDQASCEALEPLGPNTASVWVGKRIGDQQTVILNDTAYPDSAIRAMIPSTVRDIARLLSIRDPFSVGLLRCIGLIQVSQSKYRYILSLPPDVERPITLRSAYDLPEPSVTTKIQYARILGRAIMSVHAAKFVHKSIRPENIVLVHNASNKVSATSGPFLIGFEQIRGHNAHSALTADMEWYKNIYRHPSRQGLRVEDYYVMQYDIYSLGVCLLEISMWKSFVVHNTKSPEAPPVPNGLLGIDEFLKPKPKADTAFKIKQNFIDLVKNHVPSKMGDIFTEVVLSCLTCLDKGAINMLKDEAELYDEQGILVGVEFIEKILLKLEEINV